MNEFTSDEVKGIFKLLHVMLPFEPSAVSKDSLAVFLLGLALRLNRLESLSFSATEFLLFLGSSTVMMLPIELNLLEQRTFNLNIGNYVNLMYRYKQMKKTYNFALKSNSKRATAV